MAPRRAAMRTPVIIAEPLVATQAVSAALAAAVAASVVAVRAVAAAASAVAVAPVVEAAAVAEWEEEGNLLCIVYSL